MSVFTSENNLTENVVKFNFSKIEVISTLGNSIMMLTAVYNVLIYL